MEEVYSLPDGSQVDLSDYSHFDRINFLMDHPGAKKLKGVAKGANVTPKKTAQNTGSKQANGSSGSQKYRLINDNDVETLQKQGKLPPPSEHAVPFTDIKNIYTDTPEEAKNRRFHELMKVSKIKIPTGEKKNNKVGFYNQKYDFSNSKEYVDPKREIPFLKEEIERTDSNLLHPHLYYSSKNKGIQDNFIKENYNEKELQSLGVNTEDFDGYLNKKGYKQDYLHKKEEGIIGGTGTSWFTGVDHQLADEMAKNRMLNFYMEDMKRRDYTRQDLNQGIEIVSGYRDKKEIVNNELFDQNQTAKYVEKHFPVLTQKLKDRDIENRKLYEESKKGGTDFWSWDTASKMGKAGWHAVIDRLDEVSPVVYEKLGMKDTAESIRLNAEQTQLSRPDDRGFAYVSGKLVNYDGTNYIIDSKGQIYDKDARIRVTDLFDKGTYEKLLKDSEHAPSDWTFSTQGAASQTAGVVADMVLQAAVTHGVGEFAGIGTSARAALNGAGKASKFTSLLNDTSAALKMIPLKRDLGYSIIAQSTLGYTQGYENTLKEARAQGINDADAFKLASVAAQKMGALYAVTTPINPQINVAKNLFGSKQLVKEAIEQYTKTGEKGFLQYFNSAIKNAPKNALEFAQHGGAEVVQENIQQIGEIGVNQSTNKAAGKKLLNDTMTADDLMNTSILSFVSSGLISKVKLKIPNFGTKDEHIENLMSLSTLANNKKEFTKTIDGLVNDKVFTLEEADNLKKDVDIYANNINKVLKTTSPDTAMPIMRELDKITNLENEKGSVDKAFHPKIDEEIEGIRQKIVDIQYESDLKVKNEAISKAIKKGVAKGVEMKNFSNTEQLQNYLINEVGMSESDAKVYLAQPGFALNSETLKKYSKDPESIADNKQLIVVNESLTRDAGVIQHEFLHGVLQNTLKDDPESQKLIGTALTKELFKVHDALQKKGSDQSPISQKYIQRINQYFKRNQEDKAKSIVIYEAEMEDAKGDPSRIAAIKAEHKDHIAKLDGVMWEEAVTLYSDALRSGYIKYEENTFTKLGDVIRRTLQNLGIKDIKFNSGKDVYNFLKDYNRSVETGKWGKALTKMSNEGAKIGIESTTEKTTQTTKPKEGSKFSTTNKFSLGERKSSEDIKKDVNKNYNKELWSSGSNSKGENSAIDRVLHDVLGEYEYIIKGKSKGLGYANLPDFSEMDFISETQLAMIPLIRNFNKEFFQKREEYKKELESKGLDPKSQEFKDKVEAQDQKGYQGKKGIVKENNDLNAYINSQLHNKMKDALKSGNVTSQVFTDDIEGEGFKETRIHNDFGGESGEESTFLDDSDSVFDAEQDFAAEQRGLAVLLSDPVFKFVDDEGKPVNIETVPFGGFFVTEATDPTVAANRKLRTETDSVKIADLNRQLKDLARGLELQSKKDITVEEKEELKGLKSFKSYDLSTGMMVNTFEALSIEDTPAKIITDDVGREILRSPNVETLEYRNFKEKLSTLSKTMARRMTFKNGPEIESFMYNKWKLLYNVINNPVDPVTGESSYASKKLPPRLKEQDANGDFKKIKNISRVKFLQSYYGIEEATRIIKTYGGVNAQKEINELEEAELSEKDNKNLRPTTYFDRRTALMELFGDVMVLQEARRLLRQPDFLNRVAERNVNLYNELKDDIIRAKVLNDMAKGKSDIVKFTLKEEKQPRPKPDYITANPSNMIGDNPLYSLKYDELFSSPSDFIKFSLAEIDEPAPEPQGKFKNFLNNLDLKKNAVTSGDKEGWILKALQQSDVQDDDIKTKKLHTLKNEEELSKEIYVRFQTLYDSLYDDYSENEWIIQEYKEGYIDAMLERSLTIPEEAFHIPYWTKMKNDENFRNSELEKIQIQQQVALQQLAETLDEENTFGTAVFFKYLFLKDVLSNRYYQNGDESITKKSIKKSEYKTTIQPVQDYNDSDLLESIFKNYSDSKNVGIGAIYLAKKMTEAAISFDENFIQSVDEETDLYKFNKGNDEKEINSLNKLASYSSRSGYPGATWCTGASKSMAQQQLSNGDFYIIANSKSKIPSLAVRYQGDGIVEMAGTRNDQDLWPQDYEKVIFAAENLPSNNKEEVLSQVKKAKELNKLTDDEIRALQDEDVLRNLSFKSKDLNIHFESEVHRKSRIAATTLKKVILEKNNLNPSESYKIGFNLDQNEVSNVESQLDLDIIKEITEFTDDVRIKLTYPANVEEHEDFQETVFNYEDLQLNELKQAQSLDIKGINTFTAPKLTEAKSVSLEFDSNNGVPYLSLPEKINYNLGLQFFVSNGETDEVVVFDKDTDMSDKDLELYFNDQFLDGINISNVKNVNTLSITSVITDSIILPKKIKKLQTENIESSDTTEISGLKELETLEMELAGFDLINFTDLKKLEKLEITDRDEYNEDIEDVIKGSEIFKTAEEVIYTYEDHNTGIFASKTLKSKPSEAIKFSLAEEENGGISNFLEGLPFTEQWVVARDIDNAIKNSKIADGTKVTFNVPSRSKMSDKSTAYFIIQKVAEGYNDFEFKVKKNATGPLTAQVLAALDFKSKKYQEQVERNNNIEKTINDIIEENKGVKSEETFSPETAKNLGKNIGKHKIYLPPEDEDFEGLLYTLATAKGTKGEEQLKFLRDNLLKPYSDAMLNLMKARQVMYKDWKSLINKKHKGISKILKQDSGYGGYLIDQAVRVYLWKKAGYEIPGLDKKDIFNLLEIVRTNPKLRSFANDVSLLSKQANGWTEPGHNWGFGSIVGDINDIISKSNRKKYLEPWTKNVEKAFSKQNMSKIEAVYGRGYVTALRNSLERMKSGSNRVEGSNDKFLNWLNGATAVTMFANMRSAVLQLLGAVNFINTSDNNILKATAAFANAPQFAKDLVKIWNSDYLKDRRSGLMNDVAEAEIAQMMNDPRNKNVLDKFKALNYWILKQGYTPTRFADSIAIAFGGASFYRNRLNTYKKSGMTDEEAEKATMRDFYEISEQSQQSADVSKISMNQASIKGRLILAFQNTPLQYSRLIKRSVVDLIKGRGSVPNNIAKILYYGAIQNIMFNFMQNALFYMLFDDDDEQEAQGFTTAKIRALSGTMDTLLRGSGLQGAILATVKNIIVKWYEKSGDPKGYGDVSLEAANLSPSVGIKLRALAKSYKAVEYNKDEIMYKGFSTDNTYAIEALTSLTSAFTNVPADRLMTKVQNVGGALNSDYEAWQRVAMLFGYSKWNLGIGEYAPTELDTRSKLKHGGLRHQGLKHKGLK